MANARINEQHESSKEQLKIESSASSLSMNSDLVVTKSPRNKQKSQRGELLCVRESNFVFENVSRKESGSFRSKNDKNDKIESKFESQKFPEL